MKNTPIKPRPGPGLVQAPEPSAAPLAPAPAGQAPVLPDPITEAPAGAHTGSSQAPLLGQSGAQVGARPHGLDRQAPERRTGKRTSALKTRSFQDVQRQLRKPAVRLHFKELAAAVKASPALQSAQLAKPEEQS